MSVYLVKTPEGEKLVKAKTAVSAINHTIKHGVKFSAESLNVDELTAKLGEGLKLEAAE